ncbi:apolipoprotein D and lipocalin family protein [Crenobacter luteus]|uniref:lipocalin family protein n=1 Tax=Crenobacter luteus TaxID=1452487 RepID=UPI001051482D|nr:lipocalin family protein [Crenobacter luteus]TCP11114.1 apolipoprotein D and lipocalin family protein [Crenobacter luteus]
MRHALIPLLLCGLLAGAARAETPPATVAAVDLARYVGTWYEIARKPMYFERHCVRDVTATYTARADGTLRIENRCLDRDGEERRARGKAQVVPGSGNAKLKVSFFWPFTAPYWVLWLDGDYRAALVGEPGRDYLWLLSRTPQLDPALEAAALARARELGFELDDLIRPQQGG